MFVIVLWGSKHGLSLPIWGPESCPCDYHLERLSHVRFKLCLNVCGVFSKCRDLVLKVLFLETIVT